MSKFICLECGSTNIDFISDEVGKCLDCTAYFDLEDQLVKVEKIKHPHKFDDEDG